MRGRAGPRRPGLASWRGLVRQFDDEAGATPWRCLDPGAPAVFFRDLAHDGQPDAAAPRGAGTGHAPSLERTPDAVPLLRWNSGTVVVDAQADTTPGHRNDFDLDFRTITAILHGVVEQVEQHLAQRAALQTHPDCIRRFYGHRHSVWRRQGRELLDDRSDFLGGIH